MIKPSVLAVQITKVKSTEITLAPDLLAVEEPLEIRLGFGPAQNREQKRIAVTMRTPGNDFELAVGFLFTEGIITSTSQIIQIKYCTELNNQEDLGNVVRVELNEETDVITEKLNRNFYTTSSCGVCGKESIEAIKQVCRVSAEPLPIHNFDIITQLPNLIKQHQTMFKHTGGIHACALFSLDGNILLMREDVGRHNALDKLIGAQMSKDESEFKNAILLLSGRASFELIQKAAMAGIRFVCAIGAPSSLAVETAKTFGIRLIGFVKETSYNIYN